MKRLLTWVIIGVLAPVMAMAQHAMTGGGGQSAFNVDVKLPSSRFSDLPHSYFIGQQDVAKHPGVVITMDDANIGAINFGTALIDSVEMNLIGTGNSNRIPITYGVMSTNVGVNAEQPEWTDVQRAASNGKVEIALHGNLNERWGSDQNQGTDAATTGHRNKIYDQIAAHQDSMMKYLGKPANGALVTNHRSFKGNKRMLMDLGVYYALGLGVPINATYDPSSGSRDNGNTTMQRNNSPFTRWVSGTTGTGTDAGQLTRLACQGYGTILDRWNVGRTNSWSAGDPIDEYKKGCGYALQAGEIFFMTFHNIVASGATSLEINYPDFRDLVLHIDSLMTYTDNDFADNPGGGQSPYFQAFTASEAMTQLTGRVRGELMPDLGFRSLTDISPLYNEENFAIYPIGWPCDSYFYSVGADSLQGQGGADTRWKRVDAADSILAAFTATYTGDAATDGTAANDSLRFGAADSSGYVLMCTTTGAPGQVTLPLWMLFDTRGVSDEDYLHITVEAMINGTAATYTGVHGLHRFGQFYEERMDPINRNQDGTGADEYAFGWIDNTYPQMTSTRTRPMFNPALFDTSLSGAVLRTTLNGNSGTNAESYRFWSMGSLPPAIYETSGNVDIRTQFASWPNVAQTNGADAILRDTQAQMSLELRPETFPIGVRINDGVDFVAGFWQIGRIGGSGAPADVDVFVTSISASVN